jgi:hypothetical protein
MAWEDSFDTHIWLFSIGRGNAAFLRTGLNHGFVIDMASGEEFVPVCYWSHSRPNGSV